MHFFYNKTEQFQKTGTEKAWLQQAIWMFKKYTFMQTRKYVTCCVKSVHCNISSEKNTINLSQKFKYIKGKNSFGINNWELYRVMPFSWPGLLSSRMHWYNVKWTSVAPSDFICRLKLSISSSNLPNDFAGSLSHFPVLSDCHKKYHR